MVNKRDNTLVSKLTVRFALERVLQHLKVAVGRPQVSATREELGHIVLLQREGVKTARHLHRSTANT